MGKSSCPFTFQKLQQKTIPVLVVNPKWQHNTNHHTSGVSTLKSLNVLVENHFIACPIIYDSHNSVWLVFELQVSARSRLASLSSWPFYSIFETVGLNVHFNHKSWRLLSYNTKRRKVKIDLNIELTPPTYLRWQATSAIPIGMRKGDLKDNWWKPNPLGLVGWHKHWIEIALVCICVITHQPLAWKVVGEWAS